MFCQAHSTSRGSKRSSQVHECQMYVPFLFTVVYLFGVGKSFVSPSLSKTRSIVIAQITLLVSNLKKKRRKALFKRWF
jgi:hypothetical protein